MRVLCLSDRRAIDPAGSTHSEYVEQPEGIRPALERAQKKVDDGLVALVNVKNRSRHEAPVLELHDLIRGREAAPERLPLPATTSTTATTSQVCCAQIRHNAIGAAALRNSRIFYGFERTCRAEFAQRHYRAAISHYFNWPLPGS